MESLQKAQEEKEMESLQKVQEEKEVESVQKAQEEKEVESLQKVQEEKEMESLQKVQEEKEVESVQKSQEEKEVESLQKVQEKEINWFECYICKIKEVYDFKTSKKSVQYISFSENTYIVKDPFTLPEKKQFFILGSDCFVCKKPVCQSNDCSIFFKQRYCQKCAYEKRHVLPEQLKCKIKNFN